MSTRQTSRITAVVIVVLLAVIAALGAGIVTAHLGASTLASVKAGGAVFVGIAGLGTAIATFLFSPPPPSSSSSSFAADPAVSRPQASPHPSCRADGPREETMTA
ncbi:hypothetical protein ACH4OX_36485 [Streptomyces roseolus]|uniref:hypothetical protein n=1 Tax=Streptomyces roseolus TaxID=67358 RepID=UPI0037B4CB0A